MSKLLRQLAPMLNLLRTVGLMAILTSCFGSVSDPMRHYYTLHLEPLRPIPIAQIQGLLRVRDLDAESAYDRFQIVMRHSPFELVYRNKEVWAVKPNRMISDLVARGVMEQEIFSGVSRELSERRPDYLLSGELHAIEIYDSTDAWFAHVSMALQVTHFETGKLLWTFSFDDRKHVDVGNFALAVRALSELLTEAIEKALLSMEHMRSPEEVGPQDQQQAPRARLKAGAKKTISPAAQRQAPPADDDRAPLSPAERMKQRRDEPIFVPEIPASKH